MAIINKGLDVKVDPDVGCCQLVYVGIGTNGTKTALRYC